MNNCLDCGKKCSGKRCKECFIKSIGNKFEFGKWKFETQKDLDTVIKILLSECPLNIEFENEFFKELINKYHKGVNKYNLKVTKFKILTYEYQIGEWEFAKDRFRGGIYVLGFFEPIYKWHGVTLYPHKKKDIRQSLINALRQKWAENVKKRDFKDRCENCGHPYPQLHHDNITFSKIANECLNLFTKEEIEFGIGKDWWLHENEADAISNEHHAVKKMFELHKEVKYKWLCDDCHKKERDKEVKNEKDKSEEN